MSFGSSGPSVLRCGHMKYIVGTLAVVVAGLTGWFLLEGGLPFAPSARDSIYQNQDLASEAAAAAATLTAADVSWKIENASSTDETVPRQTVTLVVRGKEYPLGEYSGCIISMSAQENLEPGEIARESCWFAGAGEDLSVFKDAQGYVVMKRSVQEVPPDADEDVQPYGPFETLLRIDQ